MQPATRGLSSCFGFTVMRSTLYSIGGFDYTLFLLHGLKQVLTAHKLFRMFDRDFQILQPRAMKSTFLRPPEHLQYSIYNNLEPAWEGHVLSIERELWLVRSFAKTWHSLNRLILSRPFQFFQLQLQWECGSSFSSDIWPSLFVVKSKRCHGYKSATTVRWAAQKPPSPVWGLWADCECFDQKTKNHSTKWRACPC